MVPREQIALSEPCSSPQLSFAFFALSTFFFPRTNLFVNSTAYTGSVYKSRGASLVQTLLSEKAFFWRADIKSVLHHKDESAGLGCSPQFKGAMALECLWGIDSSARFFCSLQESFLQREKRQKEKKKTSVYSDYFWAICLWYKCTLSSWDALKTWSWHLGRHRRVGLCVNIKQRVTREEDICHHD